MTVIPTRLEQMKPVLDSWLSPRTQSYPADIVYLFIPYRARPASFGNRSGRYKLPRWLHDLRHRTSRYNKRKLKVIRTEEFGLFTSIHGALEFEQDPDTYIFYQGDDTIQHPTLIERLLRAALFVFPGSVLTT